MRNRRISKRAVDGAHFGARNHPGTMASEPWPQYPRTNTEPSLVCPLTRVSFQFCSCFWSFQVSPSHVTMLNRRISMSTIHSNFVEKRKGQLRHHRQENRGFQSFWGVESGWNLKTFWFDMKVFRSFLSLKNTRNRRISASFQKSENLKSISQKLRACGAKYLLYHRFGLIKKKNPQKIIYIYTYIHT